MDWHVLRPGALTSAEADRITRFMDRVQVYLAEEHSMYDALSSADLDALIVQRVLGWHKQENPDALDPAMRWHWVGPDGTPQQQAWWSPSTEPFYAWQLIGYLNRRDPPWRVQLVQLGYPPRTWECTLFQGALSEGVSARADTAPLAICRAALAALDKP